MSAGLMSGQKKETVEALRSSLHLLRALKDAKNATGNWRDYEYYLDVLSATLLEQVAQKPTMDQRFLWSGIC